MVDGEKCLFYGSPSTFLWEDDMGKAHHVRQGEGGEQEDPLMPLLFSLGMHSVLVAVKAKLKEGERLSRSAIESPPSVPIAGSRVVQKGAHQCPPGQDPHLEQGWTRTNRCRGTHSSSEDGETGQWCGVATQCCLWLTKD